MPTFLLEWLFMQHSSYAYKKDFKKESIFVNFLRGVLVVFQYISFIGGLILISIGGIVLFVLEFAPVQTVVTFILTRLGVYLLAEYLTVLPTYIVILLVLLPIKFSLPIALICSFFSLFIFFSI